MPLYYKFVIQPAHKKGVFMLSTYAQEKMEKIKALRGEGRSLAEALKETQTASSAYYGWLRKSKMAPTKRRKYTRRANKPFVQTIPLETPKASMKFFVMVGEPAEVIKALGELR